MKKLALILVSALMLFSIVACTNGNGNVDDNNGRVEDNNGNVGDLDGDLNDDNRNLPDNNNNGNNDGIIPDGNNENMPDVDDITGNNDNQKLTGTAQGYGGEVRVNVEVNGDDIVSVEAIGDEESEGVGSKAIEELPGKIEEADSTDVEAVSGATVTSNAIKEAVDKALKGKQ